MPSHQKGCSAVEQARARRKIELDKIGAHGIVLPDNNHVDYYEMGDRLRNAQHVKARYEFAEEILRHFNTRVAVQTALDEMLFLLHLYRVDNIHLRYKVPALYLRLGQDQEAYDFMTWWLTIPEGYNWNDRTLGFLDTKGTDAFEAPDRWVRPVQPMEMSYTVAVLLVKIRLMFGMQTLQSAYHAFHGDGERKFVANEIVDEIRGQIAVSNALTSRDVVKGTQQTSLSAMAALKIQIFELFDAVHLANMYFWRAMLAVDSVRPSKLAEAAPRETLELVKVVYKAWKETPGALKVVETRYRLFNRLPYGPSPPGL